MATVKVNSRSPYYVTSTGDDGSTVENAVLSITGPSTGVTNSDITLTAVATNFTPVSYAWTGGAIAGNSSAEEEFTETSDGSVDYGVTATDSAGNTYTATKTVTWSANPQYTATLTVTNNIVGPSQGYTIGGDLNNATQTGETGDSYSFTTTLSLNTGYTADVALAISPAQPVTGTFASADVSETTTLTGTVSRNSDYRLSVDKTSVTEGQTFTVTLIDANSTTVNGTSVPFTITGTVSGSDFQRGTLTGSFVFGSGGNANEATQTFEVLSDSTSESTSGETFILTLDNFAVSVTVTIFDQAETADPQSVLISSSNFDNVNGACAATAAETVYYGLFSGQTFGNGTTLYQSDALQTPYSGGGKYFKISTNHNGRIGVNNDGEITNYVECVAEGTTETVEESNTVPNNAVVSSNYVTVAGNNGANACALTADVDVYYNGSITEGASLFTVKAADNSLSNPFGGTDNWYKLILFDENSNPQEHYAKVLSYPPGYVSQVLVCETDDTPDTTITLTPKVTINMATGDGNNQGVAYVDQQVTLKAITQNITGPTYQWYKSATNNDITSIPGNAISGETQQTLIINGTGTETQSTTGTLYYNCLVSGTTDADTNKAIQWGNRPSYGTTFITSADTTNPNYSACTGSSVTLYTNRDGETAYCVASKFYSNAAGSSSPALTAGWYAFNDGTNHNIRYIDASGNPQGCVTGGCTETPDPTPSQPTAGYATIQKCPNQTNAGIVFDVAFDGFTRDAGQIVQLTDFAGNGTSSGCYEITQVYVTLSNWDYTLSSDEFVRLQPYGSCTECVGDIQVVIETGQDPDRYYGGYRQCNNDGAPIIYYSSNSPLPNVFRTSSNTETCRSKINDDYQPEANDQDRKFESYGAALAEFNDCTTCLEGDTITPDPIAYFRQYNNCDGNGGFVVIGSTTDLDATGHWPAVVKYSNVCYSDGGNTATTSIINITDLVTYSDCTACGYVPPTPDEPDVITTNVIKISSTTFTSITNACDNITQTIYPTTLYYTGFLGDSTQLYSDSALTRVYAPASSNYYLSEGSYYFKIGTGTGTPRGEIYNFGQCGNII
jgi:hypothetical protein